MYQMPTIGFMAIGMLIAELTGGINLSIVAAANFNGIIIHVVLKTLTNGNAANSGNVPVYIALFIGLLACILIGIINGVLIAKLKIPALLVTLGMSTLLQGLSILITMGYTLSGFPKQITWFGVGEILGIPMSIILFILVVIGLHFILDRTVYGKKLYMTGANPEAARFSNVNTDKVIIIEYVLSAFLSFCASMVMIGQMNSVKADYYESYVLIAVLATFLGGVSPNGGFGKLFGTVMASIILQLISTGLNLKRFDPYLVTAIWGSIIIIVLFGREISNKIIQKFKRRAT
jgi:simple sugar transport system permease protein